MEHPKRVRQQACRGANNLPPPQGGPQASAHECGDLAKSEEAVAEAEKQRVQAVLHSDFQATRQDHHPPKVHVGNWTQGGRN